MDRLFKSHESDKLERLQNQALRSILKKDRKTCTQWLREKCHLLSLKNRRRFLRFQLVFKIVKRHNCPEHLENYIATRASLRLRSLRDDSLLNIPTARSTMGQKTFQYSAAKDWNRGGGSARFARDQFSPLPSPF